MPKSRVRKKHRDAIAKRNRVRSYKEKMKKQDFAKAIQEHQKKMEKDYIKKNAIVEGADNNNVATAENNFIYEEE